MRKVFLSLGFGFVSTLLFARLAFAGYGAADNGDMYTFEGAKRVANWRQGVVALFAARVSFTERTNRTRELGDVRVLIRNAKADETQLSEFSRTGSR